jgi:hypothetical protein
MQASSKLGVLKRLGIIDRQTDRHLCVLKGLGIMDRQTDRRVFAMRASGPSGCEVIRWPGAMKEETRYLPGESRERESPA